MTIRGRLPYWAVLTILAVLGLTGIIVPALREWQWDHGVVNELGVAFLIAAVLGTTIDRWMKTEIAADVFRATLGYVMPKEFHSEIQKVLSFPFMCESHEMWYDIYSLQTDSVTVRVEISSSI